MNMTTFRIQVLAAALLVSGAAHADFQKRYFACASGACPVRIPDSNGTADGVAAINFAVPANVCSGTTTVGYAVYLNVLHSSIGDLRATLTNPSLTNVVFMNRPVASGSCKGDDIDATFVDGAAALTCGTHIPAVSGDVKTNAVLAVFGIAPPASGNWQLEVRDQAAGGDGMLLGAQLRVTCGYSDDIFNDSFEKP
jgi:subtilisin-like proprotein convertase family protein